MAANNGREYFQFVIQNVLKGLAWLAGIVILYILARKYIPDEWLIWLEPLTSNPPLMCGVFFASETLFGLIPLELFIFWAKEQSLTAAGFSAYVFLFACLSYLGGLCAYLAGVWAHRISWLKRLSELESFQTYAGLYRKWGVVIIILAALTPLPYATISFLSATFRFPLSRYLLYASTRFLRFLLVGWGTWYSTDVWEMIWGNSAKISQAMPRLLEWMSYMQG